MTTYATDSFDRADGGIGTADTGGAWTNRVGTWTIVSNKAKIGTPVDDTRNMVTLAVAQADVHVSVDLTLSATNNRASAGLVVRYADDNNLIRLELFKSSSVANDIYLVQRLAGSNTTLGSLIGTGALTNGNTYNIKLIISGTNISYVQDGVQRIAPAAFNSGLTTQNYGLISLKGSSDFDNGGSAWDNFLITDGVTGTSASAGSAASTGAAL
jgi:hypothetical protein